MGRVHRSGPGNGRSPDAVCSLSLRTITASISGRHSAALAMASALGVDPLIAAECLPEIEAVMVRKLNEQTASGDRPLPGPER